MITSEQHAWVFVAYHRARLSDAPKAKINSALARWRQAKRENNHELARHAIGQLNILADLRLFPDYPELKHEVDQLYKLAALLGRYTVDQQDLASAA